MVPKRLVKSFLSAHFNRCTTFLITEIRYTNFLKLFEIGFGVYFIIFINDKVRSNKTLNVVIYGRNGAVSENKAQVYEPSNSDPVPSIRSVDQSLVEKNLRDLTNWCEATETLGPCYGHPSNNLLSTVNFSKLNVSRFQQWTSVILVLHFNHRHTGYIGIVHILRN